MPGVTTFATTTRSSAPVDASREQVWEVLTDTDLLARMTPFLRTITDLGDGRWAWELHRVPLPGSSFSARFTERMRFQELERIDFSHEPAPDADETTAVTGWYTLDDRSDGRPGCHLAAWMEIRVDLPAPRWSRPAVRRSMDAAITLMGKRFGQNLVHHLQGHRA